MRIGMIGCRGVPATSGGIERAVELLGGALVARSHDVTVFCRSNYVGHPAERFAGMRLRVLPTIGTKHLDAIVHTSLSSALALRGFDVLHYHALGPGLLAPLPRVLGRDSAVVQTVHGLDWQRSKWGPFAQTVLRLGERVSVHAPHEVIVPSSALVDYYLAEYGKTVTRIPYPFRVIHHFEPVTIGERFGLEPSRYLLFVGRLTPEKQVDLLLRAFKLLDTDLRLVIVGGSSHTDEHAARLQALAADDDRVLMTGALHGPVLDELLTNACVFVSPSALEGMPITLLEAISAEVPIVASAIPPHVELLGRANGGARLHDVGSEHSLAHAIEEMLADRDRAKLALRGHRAELIQANSADRVAQLTEAVYERALAKRRRG